MKKGEKLLIKLRSGQTQGWAFSDFVLLLKNLGFIHNRTKGSHQIFSKDGFSLSIQEKNGEAKSYQLQQLKKWIEEA